MLLNIVVDMKLFNDMILRRATTSEQGNIDVLTKCIYMESTTSYVKGRGEGWGTDRHWWALVAMTALVEGGVGCWSPFVEGDGG